LGNDLIACKTYFASDVTISGVDNNPARVMQQARPEQVIDF
jgi:hypothetical protein